MDQNIIDQRIKEKNKRIQEYRSETQLSIQLGQALNLAVQCLLKEAEISGIAGADGHITKEKLNKKVDYFMDYLDWKRKEVFDKNEKAYAENPAPTPDQYEQMNTVQKSFLKDKQLEANRKAYRERNERREQAKHPPTVSIKDTN